LLGTATNNCDLAQKGINKENTVKAGPWTKPKKTRSKVLKPVSTIDFEGWLYQILNQKTGFLLGHCLEIN